MNISFYGRASEALDVQLAFIARGFGKSPQWLLLYEHIHCAIMLTVPGSQNEF